MSDGTDTTGSDGGGTHPARKLAFRIPRTWAARISLLTLIGFGVFLLAQREAHLREVDARQDRQAERLDAALRSLGEQQRSADERQLAACGFHRGWVEIPAAAASAQAAATPGAPRTPNPYLDALTLLSATAYNDGGCPEQFGILPPLPTTAPAPTPTGPGG